MNCAEERTEQTLALVDVPLATSRSALAQPQDGIRERRLLTSWKEISRYLGFGLRTVQRYEVKLGLPIHRPSGMQQGSVLAFSDELELWLRSTPLRSIRVKQNSRAQDGTSDSIDNSLRRDLQSAEEDLKRSLAEYQRCLRRYHDLKTSLNGTQVSAQVELSTRAA